MFSHGGLLDPVFAFSRHWASAQWTDSLRLGKYEHSTLDAQCVTLPTVRIESVRVLVRPSLGSGML